VTAALKDALRKFLPLRARELVSIMKGLQLFPDNQFYVKSAQALFAKMTKASGPSWLLQTPPEFRSPAYEEDRLRIQSQDALFKSLYMDFHFVQLPTNLRDFDHLSMAHGVEVRSPFMDWRLVSFLFALPATAKIGAGFTKRILRDALRSILPEAIRTRTRKLGFPNLAEAWTSPHAQTFIRDVVRSPEFRESGIWNGRKVAEDLEVAIRDRDHERLHQAWIYVQAASLMRLFQEKRRIYR
jgi:asparagine synthetase B (glutamine-hydrolysing)